MPSFHEPCNGALQVFHSGLIEKFIQTVPDNFRVGQFQALRNALVDCPQFSIQRGRKNQLIEAVDQVPVALPGSGNYPRQLFEFLRFKRLILNLLEAAREVP